MTKPSPIEDLAAIAEQVAAATSLIVTGTRGILEGVQVLQSLNQHVAQLAREEDERREAAIDHLTNVVSLRPNA